ncbi:sigma-70 family RNA polymerase sigma factor [Niastella caeni]|uniref:Sigma-70 family RNA polymerase sigma factor n=1 Tax=Niastella caeni TaxID=2569763 RepID=A0A4S8HYJ6_9BACT|nr:sigma-70 family RNA polymerase sigma factor [Niastella caeni]THU39244.1 sigma-70 family RNA polymerase sigma factor [Niastella caeni]
MRITNDLLARFNNNDPTAHEELFKTTFADLTVFVYRMINDEDESEDIAISAIRKLLSNKDLTFKAVEQLKAYLYISVRNGALNYLRSAQKEDPFRKLLQDQMPVSEEPVVNKKYEMDHMRKLIEAGLGKLEKQCAAVIRLTMLNKQPDEIAKTLNISPNQVYTQKSKGIARLRTFIEENGSKYGIPVVIILLAILCKLYFR